MKQYKSLTNTFSIKKEVSTFEKVKIVSLKDAADFCRKFYFDDLEIYESFFLLLLNNSNNTIGYVKISQGGVTGTVVDPVLIAKYAIETLAKAVILCHNHPSGNLTPSGADHSLTRKVKDGLSLFDIKVLDHIILTSDSHYSFADEGNL